MKSNWTSAVVIAIVLFDQVTKLAVKGFSLFGYEHRGMQLGESKPLIGDFVRITFIENPGMAFGIEFGAAKVVLSLFSIAAAFVLGLLLYRMHSMRVAWKAQLAIALILAGAIGNLIDRVFYGVLYGEAPLFYGRVVDFLDVDIPDIQIGSIILQRWWVFNIADAAVSCGLILLLFVGHRIPPLRTLFARSPAPISAEPDASTGNVRSAE